MHTQLLQLLAVEYALRCNRLDVYAILVLVDSTDYRQQFGASLSTLSSSQFRVEMRSYHNIYNMFQRLGLQMCTDGY